MSLHLLAAFLCALAFWLPLPFGSVLPASHTVLQVAAFLLLAAAAVLADGAPARRVVIAAACVAAVAGLGGLQALAWPEWVSRAVSPEHVRLQDAALAVATPGMAGGTPHRLTLVAGVTGNVALTWAAVAACLLASAMIARRRVARRALGATLLAAGFLELIVGTSGLARRTGEIWGHDVGGHVDRLRGSFINPDHLALYLELVGPIAFAWGWWAARRARAESAPERRVALVGPPALVWLVLFVGLAFTGSRAGLIAGVTGALVQGALLAARRRHWRLGAGGLLAVLAGLGAVAVIGLNEGLGRWLATSRYELAWNDRLQSYAASLELWQRFPWLGAGLGSFRDAFPLVAPAAIVTNVTWWHAHNDYLELLVTAGAAGGVLVGLAIAAVLGGLSRRWRDGERSEDRAAALAALGAAAAVAVHSAFDFGLSLPANAATLAILVGAALAEPRPRSASRRELPEPAP